ncbi:hypothetical protein SNE40_005166 [Patella caerulea]|uniref:G-protein coupled receptors family 1 profile domain-containing protein n=1 Tax=Patella caerulea TaxID=87958 RepID=A0AAN8Q6J9_PATCE
MTTVTTIYPTVIGAFQILFAILGTIFNCGAIVTVLSSRNLRSKGMYITIVVISFAGLLQSIYTNSVYARSHLDHAAFNNNPCPTLVSVAITDYVCLTVTMYCLVLLMLNHLIHQRSPNETRERNTGIIGTILICVLSVVVLIPVMITQSESECYIKYSFNLLVGLDVLEFFLPSFILCVAPFIHKIILKRRVMVPGGYFYQRSSVTHIIVAVFITVATTMPVTIYVLHFRRLGYPSTSTIWNTLLLRVLQMIYGGNIVVIPFSWLLDKEFRQSFLKMFKRKPKPDMTEMQTDYSNNAHQPDQVLDTNQPTRIRNTAPVTSNNAHQPTNTHQKYSISDHQQQVGQVRDTNQPTHASDLLQEQRTLTHTNHSTYM